MVSYFACRALFVCRLRFLGAILRNVLSSAITASLLARACWTDVSVLLAVEALGYAALRVVYLYAFQVVPHDHAFLYQAIRLRCAFYFHDKACVLLMSFNVSQPADFLNL